MKLHKCFFCNKIKHTPYRITEIESGQAQVYRMCQHCGKQYLGETKTSLDLSHIKTPEELLAFICTTQQKEKVICLTCGLTEEDFEKHKKMGCSDCYKYFQAIIENFTNTYHQANQHVGKCPHHQLEEYWTRNPDERMKLFKLRLAKAIEMENYEDALVFREKIKKLQESS